MSRPRIESIVKMEDARALESLINSNEKAILRMQKHTKEMRNLLWNLTTNKNARQYKIVQSRHRVAA
jgi:hypothetical protein